ncbi:MAG: TolC family protein, partial [Candidatus Accumulibacter sp.]|nr:TolC family protein [Accumulibacter sp.]
MVLSACTTVGPDFKPPLLPSWLADWSGGSLAALAAGRTGRSSAVTREWWRSLDDPVLDALIDEALRRNPNVRIAGLRILEARANLGIAGSTLYPQVQQLSGEALRVGQRQDGGPNSAFSSYGLGFGIGWELDFWGKFRRSIEA